MNITTVSVVSLIPLPCAYRYAQIRPRSLIHVLVHFIY